jgi:pimeloyl-ACP methyl ester carboxylesterase
MNELSSAAYFAQKFIQSKSFGLEKNSKLETLICLHGYVSHTSIFDDFRLQFKDYFNIICIQLPTLSYDVPKMAQIVEKEIQSQGIKIYSILGHSLGSIVALYHQLFYATTKAKKILCVASPLCGSKALKFAIGPIRIDLQRNSPVLTSIRNQIKNMTNVIFIQAKNDVLINPLTCDTYSPVIIVPIGHLGILLDPILIQICKDILLK